MATLVVKLATAKRASAEMFDGSVIGRGSMTKCRETSVLLYLRMYSKSLIGDFVGQARTKIKENSFCDIENE